MVRVLLIAAFVLWDILAIADDSLGGIAMSGPKDNLFAKALDDVNATLRNRRSDYIDTHNLLLKRLAEFKDRPAFRNHIYRVYSRADKQVGANPLKEDVKIAEKLAKWRKDKPSTGLTDIHDIIGVTIVVYFPSQLPDVVNGLKQPNALDGFIQYDAESKDEFGYHAEHLLVRCTKPGKNTLKAEVQVKTLLHDGWAAKTHDLTYKPEVAIDPQMAAHVQVLGDQIQIIEKQSDILRNLISRNIERETRRRNAAQLQLAANISADLEPEDAAARKLVTTIQTQADHFRYCSETDQSFVDCFEQWLAYVAEHGHARVAVRLITFLAGVREARDLHNLALESIGQWISSSSDASERSRAQNFLGLAYYLFGDTKRAIEATQVANQMAEQSKLKTGGIRQNLVYYMAEQYWQTRHRLSAEERKHLREETLNLASQLTTDFPDQAARIRDTMGAVWIACGETRADIKKGVAYCEQALAEMDQKDPLRPALTAFAALHEQRAYQRLSEFD